MKTKKIILIVFGCLTVLIITSAFVIKNRVQGQVKELFKMNKKLQEEGYYMAEFEFHMLGTAYYLDKGHYFKALKTISDYHNQLSKKEGLIKIPEFRNNREETAFYLNLQNPKTGAFIDDSAPFGTWWPVTENILLHLEALADSTASPIKLKYPLKFLDEINTPEKLEAWLNDVSYVGWLASKFPQTSFLFAREMLSNTFEDNVLTRNNLYHFTPEWKHAFLKWIYEFQDSTTGMWGPKDRNSKKLAKCDLDNTASILKAFRDKNGNNIYKDFPLRYGDKLFESSIKQLTRPEPGDDDLEEIHEWNLLQTKGIKMLLRYLWKDASQEDKKRAKRIIEDFVTVSFEKYYVEKEGAFSYYPNAEHATTDGMSVLIYDGLGAFSYEKQVKLWGDPAENVKDLGVVAKPKITPADFDSIINNSDCNSLRIYTHQPDFEHLTNNVWAVIYPNKAAVLDVMEVVPNIVHWTNIASLSLGNWNSMAEIKNQYSSLNIKKPLIFKENLPTKELNTKFEETGELYLVGFDKLQIPIVLAGFKRS